MMKKIGLFVLSLGALLAPSISSATNPVGLHASTITADSGINISTYPGLPAIFSVNKTSVNSTGLPNYFQGADVNVSTIPQNCMGAYISTSSAFAGASGVLTIASANIWQNYLSFILPPGVWEISGGISFNLVTSTSVTLMEVAVSSYSANTTTDHISGLNDQVVTGNSGTFPSEKITGPPPIVQYQVNLSVATTFYLKGNVAFTENSVNMRYGSMRATRK